MGKQKRRLINMSVWIVIILFISRCLISLDNIIKGISIYDLFGYASEAVGITIIIILLYEKVLWKYNPFEFTPKLSSRYKGILKSTFDNKEIDASLEIKQTLLTVHIMLFTEESKSKSLSASIDEVLGEKQLLYCYINTPKSEYRHRSEIHYGTAILSVENPHKLEGQYYTDRKTCGDMSFSEDS